MALIKQYAIRPSTIPTNENIGKWEIYDIFNPHTTIMASSFEECQKWIEKRNQDSEPTPDIDDLELWRLSQQFNKLVLDTFEKVDSTLKENSKVIQLTNERVDLFREYCDSGIKGHEAKHHGFDAGRGIVISIMIAIISLTLSIMSLFS